MFSSWYDLGYFEGLARRTASYKVLEDKAFNVANDRQYDGYQRGFSAKKCYCCGLCKHAETAIKSINYRCSCTKSGISRWTTWTNH